MRRIQVFLSSPWTPSKVWTLVSVPLSAAGIANITQSFMDLGALVIYILIFYEKIIGVLIFILNDFFKLEINRNIINMMIIVTPYSMPFIKVYTKEYTDIYHEAVKNNKFPKLMIMISIIIVLPFYIFQYFWLYIFTPFLHLFIVVLRFIFTRELDRDFLDDMSHKKANKIGFHRTCLILTILIIVSAFSFGIERWIDPEFLRLQPEHFDIKRPVAAGPG